MKRFVIDITFIGIDDDIDEFDGIVIDVSLLLKPNNE